MLPSGLPMISLFPGEGKQRSSRKSNWDFLCQRINTHLLKLISSLFFPGEILTVPIADWPWFGRLAGEVRAFKAESDMSLICTGCYLTVWIVLWLATYLFIWAGFINHLGTFFTCYSADAYLHEIIPSFLLEYLPLFKYSYCLPAKCDSRFNFLTSTVSALETWDFREEPQAQSQTKWLLYFINVIDLLSSSVNLSVFDVINL